MSYCSLGLLSYLLYGSLLLQGRLHSGLYFSSYL